MKEKYIYIAAGGAALIGLGYYFFKPKSKNQTGVIDQPATTNPTPTPVPATPVVLDSNKVLKKGVSGAEVKELQRLLGGLTVDGAFGSNTENRLKTVKGVTQITLNQYSALPTTTAPTNNITALPIGTNVMSMNRSGTQVNIAYTRADGYFYDGGFLRTIPYGSKIGKIVSKVPSGAFYVVEYTSGIFVFVAAADVGRM